MSSPHPLEHKYREEFKETLDRIEKVFDAIILESKLPTSYTGKGFVNEIIREGISSDWRPEETKEAHRLEVEQEKQWRERTQREYEREQRVKNKFRNHLEDLAKNNITDCQCAWCLIK